MKRAESRDEAIAATRDRFTSTLVIAAAIIAAVRLARHDIDRSSPRLVCAIGDSVRLAKRILEEVQRSARG